jgi:hypothetical protein
MYPHSLTASQPHTTLMEKEERKRERERERERERGQIITNL